MCAGNTNLSNIENRNKNNESKEHQIIQLDGNITGIESNISKSTVESEDLFETDDEIDNDPIPANLAPVSNQNTSPHNNPPDLDVNTKRDAQPTLLPLCLMLNARSIFNKSDNLMEMLATIGPSVTLISETWERDTNRLDSIINSRIFKYVSSYRRNKSPGGGAAIVYNESQFKVTIPDIIVPENIEAAWAVFTPINTRVNVKRIVIGSIYVSPRSRQKNETVDHIIESIHLMRAKYDNNVQFIIGGDVNRLNTTEILECYGALRQVVSVPTRKTATLSVLITDLYSSYHPPTTLPPLQVDTGKTGRDSDHNVVVFAPRTNLQYRVSRKKKVVPIRPLPQSDIFKYESDLAKVSWEEIFKDKTVDEQTKLFHDFLRTNLDKHFPEKLVKISGLDKKWMNPTLKQLHRNMQREFYKNRRSQKFKKLKTKFKQMKRKAVKSFYSNFLSDMKTSDPGKWYSMAKRLGAVDQMNDGDVEVECLAGVKNKEAAQIIAQHFAAISTEYSPVDPHQLPAYLPALPPPVVEEYDVYKRLVHIKKTRSTLPIDIPDKVRKECAVLLAEPITAIINNSLTQSVYPSIWKQEWVTPVPKVTHPQSLDDLRKISCTSDYSKLYEGYLKEWIMEDIWKNIDTGQYGGLQGIGTEHMIVCLLDRVLRLLDRNNDRSAVIMVGLDWSSAFDRQDPTIAIQKFIQLGVRPSLIPLLASYLTDRKMKVKFNGELSDFLALIGGGPQGTLLGQTEYLVQSNDNAEEVPEDDRFKYIDDLSILQLICMTGLLIDYDFQKHVASDIAINAKFLPPESYEMQRNINQISNWTSNNLMKLNPSKCNYMIFSRCKENIATRLSIGNTILERKKAQKILGVTISDDISWSQHCQEICRKAYSRMSMLTKLKYVGVGIEDLIDIYILYIRSLTEYCSVAFHSSLTVEQSNRIERIQKTCLKVILNDMYIDYQAALEMTGLQTLFDRRGQRCLQFSLRAIKHDRNSKLFPLNKTAGILNTRQSEKFTVNFATTSSYRDSAIPFCQRLLNNHFKYK